MKEKWHDRHRDEDNRKARARYCLNKEAYKARAWRSHLMRDYGLTEIEYQEIWERQAGKCAICKKDLSLQDRNTHIDHDHITGKVRGILCVSCNHGLGSFKDRVELLKAAIYYLGKV